MDEINIVISGNNVVNIDGKSVTLVELLNSTKKPLKYKKRQLVKSDEGTIWYGNKSDKCLVALDIMGPLDGKANNICIQLVDSKVQSKILQMSILHDLQQALDLGAYWIEKAAEKHAKEQKQEKQSNSSNRGEKDVEHQIKWIVKSLDKYIIPIDNNCESKYRYNCILLKNPSFIDEAQEYDHIIATPAGIVLIETKDWKGTIEVNTDGKWIRHKEGEGTPCGVASPISQMRRHEQLMQSILPDVSVYSILCFSNPSAIINGQNNISEYPVIYIEQLEGMLKSVCAEEKYSTEDIDSMVAIIESHKIKKV